VCVYPSSKVIQNREQLGGSLDNISNRSKSVLDRCINALLFVRLCEMYLITDFSEASRKPTYIPISWSVYVLLS
jgi:hypothetical protein